ncbi:MAG: DNA polymerase III subunit alpha [Thermovenabulum sp.]|uniref:DNA polymerase III subunit alpha n=1 Tax=Thermovenabulum sp. TaxID=3100335 RepID=UPI003C7973F5
MLGFVHLHLHTNYSLLDGACSIERLVTELKKREMSAAAITDHGVMYGVIEFYKAMKKEGLKPIIGCEVYMAKRSLKDKEPGKDDEQYHLVLLAKDNEGYKNLMKLASIGFIDGFYYKPRIDKDLLRKYSKGLIGLSACLAGEIPAKILEGDYDEAKKIALDYLDIFGRGNFYLELQDHKILEQKKVNQTLVKLSKETGIPLVATNDVHYISREDAEFHDALLCIQTGKTLKDKDRLKFPTDEFYLKTEAEMKGLFYDIPEALENTVRISEMCDVEIEFNKIYLPDFKVPEGYTHDSYLEKLCYDGLLKRYGAIEPIKEERLKYELDVIKKMGYSAYFLIVWDYVNYAKKNQIMVGPGRGSAAGSLVAYCLGITDIDPLKYNLLFERFLNPERVTMPDIDVDFCFERREEVIKYVINKYGEERVAQIGTFGTMAARAAVRDVGRVLGYPYGEVDVIAKMIPMELGMTVDKALELNPELKKRYEEDDKVKKLIDIAKAIEGFPRHASTHAAGIVISALPLMELVPLHKVGDTISTQYTMTNLEEIGLLKMDFLGLRTLTVIRDALDLIKKTRDMNLDIKSIPLDDKKVYELLSSGETLGVFQLESNGMRNLLKELKPERFEDIIAVIGLYRPGPLGSGAALEFIKNKNGRQPIKYLHPKLKPILEETYGIILYQEQAMKIAQELAGFTLAQADILRKAMGKKQQDVMQAQKNAFIEGCMKNGIEKEIAERIFEDISYFAGYGFNKSHAAAYALIAYQTAYLKAHFPVEYMAALLSSVMQNLDKVALYISECRRMGIDVLPPDVNESYENFTVVDGKIRFGLSAVKNVGESAVKNIIKAREEKGKFKSLTDFCEKLSSGELNKRFIESLIMSGAMDSFGAKRSQLMAIYEDVLEKIQKKKNEKNVDKNQVSFLDLFEKEREDNEKDELPEIPEYEESQLLSMEKEMLGLYLSGHPLKEFEDYLKKETNLKAKDLVENDNLIDGINVIVGGIISNIKLKSTKENKIMAFLKLEDLTGSMEVIVFPAVVEKYKDLLKPDNKILIKGRLNLKEEEAPKILAEEITPLEIVIDSNKKRHIIICVNRADKDLINMLKEFFLLHPGDNPVTIYINEYKKAVNVGKEFYIDGDEKILEELMKIKGVQGYLFLEKFLEEV